MSLKGCWSPSCESIFCKKLYFSMQVSTLYEFVYFLVVPHVASILSQFSMNFNLIWVLHHRQSIPILSCMSGWIPPRPPTMLTKGIRCCPKTYLAIALQGDLSYKSLKATHLNFLAFYILVFSLLMNFSMYINVFKQIFLLVCSIICFMLMSSHWLCHVNVFVTWTTSRYWLCSYNKWVQSHLGKEGHLSQG